jgi:hypothetical protein
MNGDGQALGAKNISLPESLVTKDVSINYFGL